MVRRAGREGCRWPPAPARSRCRRARQAITGRPHPECRPPGGNSCDGVQAVRVRPDPPARDHASPRGAAGAYGHPARRRRAGRAVPYRRRPPMRHPVPRLDDRPATRRDQGRSPAAQVVQSWVVLAQGVRGRGADPARVLRLRRRRSPTGRRLKCRRPARTGSCIRWRSRCPSSGRPGRLWRWSRGPHSATRHRRPRTIRHRLYTVTSQTRPLPQQSPLDTLAGRLGRTGAGAHLMASAVQGRPAFPPFTTVRITGCPCGWRRRRRACGCGVPDA